MRVGEILQLHIESMSSDGAGLARHGGMVLFVSGAVSGDTVSARVTQAKPRFARAETLRVLQPSPQRREPPCPRSGRCGGCEWQTLRYEAQLAAKAASVSEALRRIGGMEIAPPQVHSFAEFRYRNRVQWHYDGERLGFYDRRSHSCSDIDGCLLAPPLFDEIRRFLEEGGLPASLRHCVLQANEDTSRLQCIFRAASFDPAYAKLAWSLCERFPQVGGVWLALPERGRDDLRLLTGEESLRVRLLGSELRLYPSAFLQVNYAGCEALYARALSWAALKGSEKVYDVYCGVGALTLLLARQAGEALGIEYNEQAVAAARRNAELSGLSNCRFVCEKAELALPRLAAEGGAPDLIVLDPPRAGCAPEVLQALCEAAPQRVIYISCDPATLARDLRRLAADYSLQAIECYDLFPQTPHIETAALLTRAGTEAADQMSIGRLKNDNTGRIR